MAEQTPSHPDPHLLRQQGLSLSQEFSRLEGRQPRVLVSKSEDISVEEMRYMSSCMADMGFDVDLAPGNNPLEALAGQCVENDSDVLLILGAQAMTLAQLDHLYIRLNSDCPETVCALYFSKPAAEKVLKEVEKMYRVFPENADQQEISLALLKLLFSNN